VAQSAPVQRPAAPVNKPSRPATPFEQPASSDGDVVAEEISYPSKKLAPVPVTPWWRTWQAIGGIAAAVVLIVAIMCVILFHSGDTSSPQQIASNSPPATPAAPARKPATPAPAEPNDIFHQHISMAAPSLAASLGDFQDQRDIGAVKVPGHTEYSELDHRYVVTGSGEDIYYNKDAFHFVYRKAGGDITLKAKMSFRGSSKQKFRKACLMIRESLDPEAAYVDVALHGDGSINIQSRPKKGDQTSNKPVSLKAPAMLQIERRGNIISVYGGKPGEALKNLGSVTLAMKDPVYAGLAVCSHDVNSTETAVFDDCSLVSSH
jgi:regulation of enolase protein 1 (concanavalin A-like superfamily)